MTTDPRDQEPITPEARLELQQRYSRPEIEREIRRLERLLEEPEDADDARARRQSVRFLVVFLICLVAYFWAIWAIWLRGQEGARSEEPAAAVHQEDHSPRRDQPMSRTDLTKAMSDAFDAHEKHRESVAETRKLHKRAREADDRVRHLRSLERERQATRSRGRAA